MSTRGDHRDDARGGAATLLLRLPVLANPESAVGNDEALSGPYGRAI
jgi:hypothetical protein